MNKQERYNFPLAAFLLITLLSAGTAAAQNTKFGVGALASPSSSNLGDSAFGFDALNAPTSGFDNTAVGIDALQNNTTGVRNTAAGASALEKNTTGGANTATGEEALLLNTTGSGNTATGTDALLSNTSGSSNTATGVTALSSNTTGGGNTADGAGALAKNTTGFNNTAAGGNALQNNTIGVNNTATGTEALGGNTMGSNNTATGEEALTANTTGDGNTATGIDALLLNTTGAGNTAAGFQALLANKTGGNNIGIGSGAGKNLTTGSDNIEIGNAGGKLDSKTIRIGTQGTQTATYIAGISGTMVVGSDVAITAAGRLGIVMSSARYKRDIQDMGASSSGLLKLRPVTFRYKNDPAGTLQYGLVAEEVANLYPELVSYGPDGEVLTVRYSTLSAMLLNELQKQTRKNDRQARQIETLSAKVAEVEASTRRALDAQRAAFEQRLSRLEQPTQAKDGNHNLVAAFNK